MIESRPLPERLPIEPLTRPVDASVCVPGSKSITNRAMVLAALSGRDDCLWELKGVLRSEDTEVMLQCLESLGFVVETRWAESRIRVGADFFNWTELIPYREAELFVGNSGTTMRFLTAM